MLKRFFRYIEPIWLGNDGKMSLRATLAIAFSYNFIYNLSYAINKWDAGRSLEGLSLVLGIEAGLVVSLLGLTTYANMAAQKIDSLSSNLQPASINIQSAENVNSTQAKSLTADKVDTVNSTNTTINKTGDISGA